MGAPEKPTRRLVAAGSIRAGERRTVVTPELIEFPPPHRHRTEVVTVADKKKPADKPQATDEAQPRPAVPSIFREPATVERCADDYESNRWYRKGTSNRA